MRYGGERFLFICLLLILPQIVVNFSIQCSRGLSLDTLPKTRARIAPCLPEIPREGPLLVPWAYKYRLVGTPGVRMPHSMLPENVTFTDPLYLQHLPSREDADTFTRVAHCLMTTRHLVLRAVAENRDLSELNVLDDIPSQAEMGHMLLRRYLRQSFRQRYRRMTKELLHISIVTFFSAKTLGQLKEYGGEIVAEAPWEQTEEPAMILGGGLEEGQGNITTSVSPVDEHPFWKYKPQQRRMLTAAYVARHPEKAEEVIFAALKKGGYASREAWLEALARGNTLKGRGARNWGGKIIRGFKPRPSKKGHIKEAPECWGAPYLRLMSWLTSELGMPIPIPVQEELYTAILSRRALIRPTLYDIIVPSISSEEEWGKRIPRPMKEAVHHARSRNISKKRRAILNAAVGDAAKDAPPDDAFWRVMTPVLKCAGFETPKTLIDATRAVVLDPFKRLAIRHLTFSAFQLPDDKIRRDGRLVGSSGKVKR